MAEVINWGNLPNIPRILVDFVARRAHVVSLLGGDWRDADTLSIVGERRAKFNRMAGLGDALRAGYGEIEIPDGVERNLDALNRPDTLAIVTGQQVGIFGGPLFTFYKALTTIFLANRLEDETPGRVVPIFWMETADADFGEVNRLGFPAGVNNSHHLVYTPHDIAAGRSVNFHEFTDEIDEVRSAIHQWLEKLPHSEKIFSLIDRSYHAGRRISEGFMELMTGLLGDMGLVMINPMHPAVISRTVDFWDRCLFKPDKLNKSYNITARELAQQHYPLQVRMREDALPILYIDNDGTRRRIRGHPGYWRVSLEGEGLIDRELQALGREHPESLSPSALLRPVMQDWLLPTWIYVAGASEVAYHAQIGRCYDLLNIPRPLVVPRISATIVEPTARRLLDRNGWTVMDVIGGRQILLRSSGKAETLTDLFDSGEGQLEGWLERIERAADEAAVNISLEMDRSGRKLLYQWEKLKRITLNKIAERDKARVDHADRLLKLLMSDGMLQERHDNALYYLAAYGEKLIGAISLEADLFRPQHLVIDMETK